MAMTHMYVAKSQYLTLLRVSDTHLYDLTRLCNLRLHRRSYHKLYVASKLIFSVGIDFCVSGYMSYNSIQ